MKDLNEGNPFETETPAQRARRVGQMIRENLEKQIDQDPTHPVPFEFRSSHHGSVRSIHSTMENLNRIRACAGADLLRLSVNSRDGLITLTFDGRCVCDFPWNPVSQ